MKAGSLRAALETMAPKGERGGVAVRCILPLSSVLLSSCVQLLDVPDDPQLAPDVTQAEAQAAGGASSSTGSSGAAGAREGQRAEEAVGGDDGNEEDRRPEQRTPDDQTTTETGETRTPADDTDDGEGRNASDAGSPDGTLEEGSDNALADAGPPSPNDAAPPEPFDECGGLGSLGPNQRCFLVLDAPLSWEEARLACIDRGEGWDLASIRSSAVNAFAASLTGDELWLGATDATSEGNWVWVSDGLPFWLGNATGAPLNGAFANWNADEPNGGGNSDCARIVPGLNGIWADLECDFERLPLCEGPPP